MKMAKLNLKTEKVRIESASDSGFFYAALLKSSGEILVHRFPSPEFKLPWLQEAVGGYIEIVRGSFLPGDAYLVVNEDGHYMDLPFNLFASFLYSGGAHPIVGDAVLCCDFDARFVDFEPDCYAAPFEWLYRVLTSFGVSSDTPLLD